MEIQPRLYRKLDPAGAIDQELCSRIYKASNDYKDREPVDSPPHDDDGRTLSDKQKMAMVSSWVHSMTATVRLAVDGRVIEAYQDFLYRFDRAFRPKSRAGSERWVCLLSARQVDLFQAVLIELRNEVKGSDPKQGRVILLSRTPYALFERLRTSWTAHTRNTPKLPFPEPFMAIYPERIELAVIVNNAAPAEWPTRTDLDHRDVAVPPHFAVVADLLELALRLATERTEQVHQTYHDFMRDQTETCLGMLKSEEAQAWYDRSDVYSKRFFHATALRVHVHAQVMGKHCGALWTIRHLHHYTAVAFDQELVKTVGPSTLPFFGSHRAHETIHQYHEQLRAAGTAAQSLGNFRRNLIYGRERSSW